MTEQTRQRLLLGVAAALLLVALLSLGPAAWANPGQDHLRQTIPTPIPDPYTIVLPPQRDGKDYSFEFDLLPSVECPPPAGCELFAPFSLEAYLGTELVYPVTFDPPLEICYHYTQAQADAVGGADNLALVYWDPERAQWIPLDNRRADTDLMMVCGDISFLPDSPCGLAVSCLIGPTGVPVTGQPAGSTPAAGRLAIVALVLAVALVGVALTRRRRAPQDS